MRNADLVAELRSALGKVRIKPAHGYVSEKVSILNESGIPAVAVGVTTGSSGPDSEEIDLGLIEQGFRQLLMVVEGSSKGGDRSEN